MAASSTSNVANLSQDQFLSLLVAGLQNQDPMQPMDSSTFLTQISQFSDVQSLQTLNASFSQMLQLQQLTNGSALIGRTVNYSQNGTSGSGQVTGLSVQNGNILLGVGSAQVSLDQIQSVG